MAAPPDQDDPVLEHVPGRYLVVRASVEGAPALTRVFLRPVVLELDALVRGVAVGGRPGGAELPAELAAELEGFRVRAGLDEVPGLPAVLAAGVSRTLPTRLPALAAAFGYGFVSTQWLDGTTLASARDTLGGEARAALGRDLLALLARVHERGVVLGGLRAEQLRVTGSRVWLTDVSGLRAGGADPAHDVGDATRIVAWLGEEVVASAATATVAVPDATLAGVAPPPRTRPGPAPAAATEFVPDDATEFVPDEPAPAPRPRRRLAIALALLVLAGLAAGALWLVRSRLRPATPPRPFDVEARCGYRKGRARTGAVTIACTVSNPRTTSASVRVTGLVYRDNVPEPAGTEEGVLEPGERRVYHFEQPRSPAEARDSRCECDVDDQDRQ